MGRNDIRYLLTSKLWSPGVIRPSVVRTSTLSNIFSEVTGPIEAKLHMVGETKVCSRGLGHMTKMAAIPIYHHGNMPILY